MRRGGIIFFIVGCIAIMQSCVRVNIVPAPTQDVKAQFAFSWPTSTPHPSEVHLAVTRTEQEEHKLLKCSVEDPDEVYPIGLYAGEYFATAFAYPSKSNWIIPGAESFRNDNSYPMKSIIAAAPEVKSIYKRYEIDTRMKFEDVTDEISVIDSVSTMFCGTSHMNFKLGDTLMMAYSMKQRTCEVNLSMAFDFQDISISQCIACISGVPSQMCLMTADVDRGSMARVFMPLEKNTSGKYTATTRVMGIFIPDSFVLTEGVGILHIYLFSPASGSEADHSYHITLNLTKYLESSPLLVRNKETDRYSLCREHLDLNIPTITISRVSSGEIEFKWADGSDLDASETIQPPSR